MAHSVAHPVEWEEVSQSTCVYQA